MLQPDFPDVLSPDEVAQAARVPRQVIDALVARGDLRLLPGSTFIAAADAVRVGRALYRPAVVPPAPDGPMAATLATPAAPDLTRPVAFSGAAHLLVLLVMLAASASGGRADGRPETVTDTQRLVFLVSPGVGGGGGGGGVRSPVPAAEVRRAGAPAVRRSTPLITPAPAPVSPRATVTPPTPAPQTVEPVQQPKEPDPLPSKTVVAPVVAVAADSRERDGVLDAARESDSQGSGAGGGAGVGQGTGVGEGAGTGLGDGSGGGTGGGPYRPGSGIEPPRLLREVKADYSDEARRRNLSGDVVLEIVVRRDGTVGDVTVLKGLGAGLDQRAVDAVRQWRFEPARRKGIVVDVVVEVAVEFTLR